MKTLLLGHPKDIQINSDIWLTTLACKSRWNTWWNCSLSITEHLELSGKFASYAPLTRVLSRIHFFFVVCEFQFFFGIQLEFVTAGSAANDIFSYIVQTFPKPSVTPFFCFCKPCGGSMKISLDRWFSTSP